MAGSLETTGRARAPMLTGLLAAAVALGLALQGANEPASGGSPVRPNIIVVITDDQDRASFNGKTMPYTRRAVAKQGTTFSDAIVTSPLCCPSRASFMTGQYTHNHGAWNSYATLSRPGSHLGSWLQREGYRTAMLGKYLNHYDKAVSDPARVAPGWDRWRMLIEPLSYYGYDLSVNGRRSSRGSGPEDYSTTVLGRAAAELVRDWAPSSRPFFLWLAPHAPHDENIKSSDTACGGRAVPAPGDEGSFPGVGLPRPPSFNERKMADKPRFMRTLKRLDREEVAALELAHRCRLESLREVDRGVRDVVEALRDKHDLNDTVIVFTSDNGLFEGQHRLKSSKRLAYSEAIEVPFAMRVPPHILGGEGVGRVARPVANIDLAPTLLDLAGAEPCVPAGCRVMDGRSMTAMLRGEHASWPTDRGRGLEMRDCRYRGILASDQLAVHHISVPRRPGRVAGCRGGDAFERYRMDQDPFQLRNLARTARDIPTPLMMRLRDVNNCAGIAGRDPAPPAGRSYCE